jgi:transcriptional/translational regulatory protein YebC/TACO1
MWLPLMETELSDEEEKQQFDRLMDMLNELDDVQEVYHNVKQAE